MKRFPLFLSALLIVSSLSLAGCASSSAENSGSEASSGSAPSAAASAIESGTQTFASKNDSFEMSVVLDKAAYDVNAPIATKVTVKNIGDAPLVYVHGSGSSLAPDALSYTIGEFAPMYIPEAMTMDYRNETLEPGQSLELDLNFAPYIPKDKNLPIGNDKEIEFFKSDDFTPATPGTYEGNATFTCRIVPASASSNPDAPESVLGDFESFEAVESTIDFTVTIQ